MYHKRAAALSARIEGDTSVDGPSHELLQELMYVGIEAKEAELARQDEATAAQRIVGLEERLTSLEAKIDWMCQMLSKGNG